MTVYNVLKVAHIVAVVCWFGGTIVLVVMTSMVRRSSNDQLAAIANVGGRMGAFFGGTAGLAFLTGIGMMVVPGGPEWAWSATFVNIGLVVFFVGSFLGARIIGPGYEKLSVAASSGDAAAIETQWSKLTVPTMLNLGLLLLTVAAMVFKW